MSPHKAGFVNIIGSPNTGKSTLMNALTGEKLSIITSKAQTTRHRIMGIVNGENFQIVYSDTPGVIKPGYKLHESMMKHVQNAFADADIILFVTDIFENEFKDGSILKKIQNAAVPVILLINKIDLGDQIKLEERVAYWKSKVENALIIPVSALKKFNVNTVFDKIMEKLPESPPYFPKDDITDKSQRFFISEIIREKIFLQTGQEIPYSTAVTIESFKENAAKQLITIHATIYVEKDSQKGIIIGKNGSKLKQLGQAARKDIEILLDQHVLLKLWVKVQKDWTNDPRFLRELGF